MMRLVYKNDHKQIFKDNKTGVEKTIWTSDPKEKEAIASGATLQPIGKDERKFFDKYRHLKKDSTGRIYEPIKERKRKREREEEANIELRENWNKSPKQKSKSRYWNRNYESRYQRIFKT